MRIILIIQMVIELLIPLGPSNRMDYRDGVADHPVFCLDNKYATFYDDAFSLSPQTGYSPIIIIITLLVLLVI